jgi:hypothetical protein
MNNQKIYQSLKEIQRAKNCLTCATKRYEANSQLIEDSLSKGNFELMSQNINDYSMKMHEIHQDLLQGKLLGTYKGLKYYIGEKKKREFIELITELELISVDATIEDAIIFPGNTIKFFNNIFLQKKSNMLSILKPSVSLISFCPYILAETQSNGDWSSQTLKYVMFGISSFLYIGFYSILDAASAKCNPHLKLESILNNRRKEIIDLFNDYKENSI